MLRKLTGRYKYALLSLSMLFGNVSGIAAAPAAQPDAAAAAPESAPAILHDFIRQGANFHLRHNLEQGLDPNQKDGNGDTPLIVLAANWYVLRYKDREEMFRLLIEHGADLKLENRRGQNAVDAAFRECARSTSHLRDGLSLVNAIGDSGFDLAGHIQSHPDALWGILERQGREMERNPYTAYKNEELLTALLQYLTDKGVILDHIVHAKSGMTLAHMAVALGSRPLLTLLNDNNFTLWKAATKNGLTISHVAAMNGDMKMLDFMERNGLADWNAATNKGATAADYAFVYKHGMAVEWFKNKNIMSGFEKVAKLDISRNIEDLVKTYDQKAFLPESLDRQSVRNHFGMLPVLETPKYDTHKEPVVIITEHVTRFLPMEALYGFINFINGIFGGKISHPHIEDTRRAAQGTAQRLAGSRPPVKVIGFNANPVTTEKTFENNNDGRLSSLFEMNEPSFLLQMLLQHPGTEDGDIIYSQSIGTEFSDRKEGQTEKEYKAELMHDYQDNDMLSPDNDELNYFLSLNPILPKALGNDSRNACLDFGTSKSLEACLGDYTPLFFSARSASVGAAEKMKDGRWKVHYYSEEQPTFCAPVPYDRDGDIYRGTSFTGPLAATIEAELMRLHGRSAQFPDGVTHEDIILALRITADRNIVDEVVTIKDHAIVKKGLRPVSEPFAPNGAGIMQSRRCGAGVILADKANLFLREMVAATHNNLATPTILENLRVEIDTARPAIDPQGPHTGGAEYRYDIKIPQTGAVTKPYILLNFEKNDKGAVILISPRGTTSIARLGLDGEIEDHSFWGENWQEGETLTLITTRPLKPAKTFALIRITPPDSAFAYAAKNWRAMTGQTLYKQTDFNKKPPKPPPSQPQQNVKSVLPYSVPLL